jgi:hypothetical protein
MMFELRGRAETGSQHGLFNAHFIRHSASQPSSSKKHGGLFGMRTQNIGAGLIDSDCKFVWFFIFNCRAMSAALYLHRYQS